MADQITLATQRKIAWCICSLGIFSFIPIYFPLKFPPKLKRVSTISINDSQFAQNGKWSDLLFRPTMRLVYSATFLICPHSFRLPIPLVALYWSFGCAHSAIHLSDVHRTRMFHSCEEHTSTQWQRQQVKSKVKSICEHTAATQRRWMRFSILSLLFLLDIY